jgi:rubrerythrin
VNIVEYALNMEKDGEACYRDLAAAAGNQGIKEIFEMLADAEAKHYQAFLHLKSNKPPLAYDENLIARAKNIFQQLQLNQASTHVSDDQVEAYKKARDIESESRKFYLQKADELLDPAEKELCLKIAEEEKQHYILLDNLIDFLARPNTWVESAEWTHRDSY